MKEKRGSGKYIVIAILVLAFVAAAFLLVHLWENGKGRFFGAGAEEGVVEYRGKEYVLRDDVETFLVLGLDKFQNATDSASHESGTIQADSLVLFVFDKTAKQTRAIQINRDTMVNVNQLDIAGNKTGVTEKKQIALAYHFAYKSEGSINCRNTADSVSDLLKGIKVDHYISMTMDSVVMMNDLVGGVDLTVLGDFSNIDKLFVEGEEVTLTGEMALEYVRARQGMGDSTNIARMERQAQYMDALMEKVTACIEADASFLVEVADQMKPYLEYDSTDYRLKEFMERFEEYEFLGITNLEGETKEGENFMEFYPDENALWELVIDWFYVPKKDK